MPTLCGRGRHHKEGGLARPRDRPPSRLPDCLLAAYLPAACLSAWHRTNWPIDRTLCTELSNTSMNPPSEWDAHAETNESSYIALLAAFRRLRQYLMIEQYQMFDMHSVVTAARCGDSIYQIDTLRAVIHCIVFILSSSSCYDSSIVTLAFEDDEYDT